MSEPRITLIAALTPGCVIGRDNDLPWRIPDDLRYFKRMTRGKPVVMGRRNFESIGRPLPERHNIVLSRDPTTEAPGCTVVTTLPAALEAAGDVPEVMVIGGAEVYRLFLPRADRLLLTWVDAEIPGDTYFPEYDPAAWRSVEVHDHPAGPGSPYPLRFETLERRD